VEGQGADFKCWSTNAKQQFIVQYPREPCDYGTTEPVSKKRKSGRLPYRDDTDNTLLFNSQETPSGIGELAAAEAAASASDKENHFKAARRTIQANLKSKKKKETTLAENTMLQGFLSSHLFLLSHFKWLYANQKIDLAVQFDTNWPKFLATAESFLLEENCLRGFDKVKEAGCKTSCDVFVLRRLNEYLDQGSEFNFIGTEDSFQKLDPKKNFGAFIIMDPSEGFSVFFERQKLKGDLSLDQALQYYFALSYITAAEYCKVNIAVSNVVSRSLFGMKETKEMSGEFDARFCRYRMYEAEYELKNAT